MSDGAPGAPLREALRRAAALVYVDDLDQPVPTDTDLHHLASVLRLRPGESVIAGDGRGGARRCVVGAIDRRARGTDPSRALEVVAPTEWEVDREPAEQCCVAFALIKGERSEWAIQKLTEIGVDRITPLHAERSVVRLSGDEIRRRSERFRRIAREAAAQSRRLRLPRIDEAVGLVEFVESLEDPSLFALAEPCGEVPVARLRTIAIGPEGGWSEDELKLGQQRVDLGSTVLRAETAALVAGTLLRASVQEIGHGA